MPTFNRNIILAFLFSLMTGCAPGSGNYSNPGGSNNSSAANFQAVCQISSGASVMVCIDFPNASDANQASCTSAEQSRYATAGGSAAYIGASSPGASISCSGGNPNLNTVGSCGLADRNIRYYNSSWTATTAQADCGARAGNWIH